MIVVLMPGNSMIVYVYPVVIRLLCVYSVVQLGDRLQFQMLCIKRGIPMTRLVLFIIHYCDFMKMSLDQSQSVRIAVTSKTCDYFR